MYMQQKHNIVGDEAQYCQYGWCLSHMSGGPQQQLPLTYAQL